MNSNYDSRILNRWSNCQAVSLEITTKHILYISIVQCLIPICICFACCYGVAVLCYKGVPDKIGLWLWPLPLAGNFAATILIENVINYFLMGTIQTFDVFNGVISPLHPNIINNSSWFPDRNSSLRWYLQPPELLLKPVIETPLITRITNSLKRSLFWTAVTFMLVWPLITIICYALYGNYDYTDFPGPQLMTAILGGVLALITCPLWCYFNLIEIGERVIREQELIDRNIDTNNAPLDLEVKVSIDDIILDPL